MMRKTLIALAVLLAFAAGPAQAQISDGVVKIGVMNDQAGLYADLAGMGSVVAARMAARTSARPPRA
jgi:branched-chain amino acid transport system substrate-binding protein